MNKVYIYDGDYLSLIALIVELMKNKLIPDDIEDEMYQNSLFDESVYLEVLDKKDNIKRLRSIVSNSVLLRIYYVYLSDKTGKEILIYKFLKYALVYKDKVFSLRRINEVNEVIKISQQVSNEAHKLKGFLRFKEVKNNFLYACYSSSNFVLPILVNHFEKRLKNENFVIYDEKRLCYAFYYQKKVFYLDKKDIVKLNLENSDMEMKFESLWKIFYKTIAISERENKRNRMNFMPKKYWKNIIEMEKEE